MVLASTFVVFEHHPQWHYQTDQTERFVCAFDIKASCACVMVTLILSVLDVKVCWIGHGGFSRESPRGPSECASDLRCSKKRVEAETIADWMA